MLLNSLSKEVLGVNNPPLSAAAPPKNKQKIKQDPRLYIFNTAIKKINLMQLHYANIFWSTPISTSGDVPWVK